MENFYRGNLNADREDSLKRPKGQREWLIGDFEQFEGSVQRTKLLELKYWRVDKKEVDEHKTKVQKLVGEITIILEGKTKGFIGKEDVDLSEGEYVYISPGIVNNLIVEVIEGEYVKGLTIKAPSDTKDGIKILRIE